MTIEMLQLVMKQGDNHGSALRSLLKFYHIEDNDLSPITDDMARTWLKRQKCKCWQKGHWFLKDHDTCNGTKDREPCNCKGDVTNCDFYDKSL
jgi:hypothetical protein